MLRTLAILLVIAAAWSPARAEDDFEARKALAREYVDIFVATTDLRDMALSSAAPLFDRIARDQPDLWQAKQDVITEIYVSHVAERLATAMISLDAPMAQVFTLEELRALRDFYASPEGRAVLAKMPAFMKQVMPWVLAQGLADPQEMIAALLAEGVNLQPESSQ